MGLRSGGICHTPAILALVRSMGKSADLWKNPTRRGLRCGLPPRLPALPFLRTSRCRLDSFLVFLPGHGWPLGKLFPFGAVSRESRACGRHPVLYLWPMCGCCVSSSSCETCGRSRGSPRGPWHPRPRALVNGGGTASGFALNGVEGK